MKQNDREALEAMIVQMNRSTERADAALDEALAFITESEKRIANPVAIDSDYPSEAVMDEIRQLSVPPLKKTTKSLFTETPAGKKKP